MDRSNLSERAADILATANLLSGELVQLGLPEPSFEHGLPAPLHRDAPQSKASTIKQKLLQMLDEFGALLTEPTLHLTSETVNRLHLSLLYDLVGDDLRSVTRCSVYIPSSV